MAKTPTVTTITSGYASNTQLNANFVALRDAFSNTLSLDGSTPNTLTADLDLGTQDLLNVGNINGTSASGLSANLGTVAGISGDIATVAGISADVTQVAADTVAINAASANASAAAASAGAASTSETNAAASEAAAAASYDSFDDRYLGAKASNPAVDNDGDPLITGALYFNTTSNEMRTWSGSAWVASFVTLAGALIATNNLSDLASAATALTNLGVTSTAAELNILDGVTSTAAELNILDGVTASTAEINHLVGVTSPIQTQIDNATPFKPTTVTGTTPSLDIGSYNFFDHGTLSADTTVSFASVPTEANWRYSFEPSSDVIYDLSVASYDGTLYAFTAQDTDPRAMVFKPDGLKLYMWGRTGRDVSQYTLSTAWDLSTISYDSKLYANAMGAGLEVGGLFFRPDGLKWWAFGYDDDTVYSYDMSTAWDITTSTASVSKSLAAQLTQPAGLFFKPDGLTMYAGDRSATEAIYQYTLSTAWDISTATYASKSFSVAEDINNYAFELSPDGTRMLIVGGFTYYVYQYTLSTPWDMSTATYDSVSFNLSGQTTDPRFVTFKPDGSKMYVLGTSADTMYQYNVTAATAVTLPASVQNPPTEVLAAGDNVTYEFYTLDGGTTVTLINEEVL